MNWIVCQIRVHEERTTAIVDAASVDVEDPPFLRLEGSMASVCDVTFRLAISNMWVRLSHHRVTSSRRQFWLFLYIFCFVGVPDGI